MVNLEQEAGKSFSYDQLKKAVEKHKPAVLFLCQVRTVKANALQNGLGNIRLADALFHHRHTLALPCRCRSHAMYGWGLQGVLCVSALLPQMSDRSVSVAQGAARLRVEPRQCTTQGESSTGVHQNLAGLGDLCKGPMARCCWWTQSAPWAAFQCYADEWGVDAIYSGSQKVLAAPARYGQRSRQ